MSGGRVVLVPQPVQIVRSEAGTPAVVRVEQAGAQVVRAGMPGPPGRDANDLTIDLALIYQVGKL